MEEWEQRIEDLRGQLRDTSLGAFVRDKQDKAFHTSFEKLVNDLNHKGRQRLGDQAFEIISVLEEQDVVTGPRSRNGKNRTLRRFSLLGQSGHADSDKRTNPDEVVN